VVVALLVVALGGCASLAPNADGAAEVAEAFHRAVVNGDGTAECALLAPETAVVLEQDSGEPCADAVLDEDIPDGGAVLGRQAYGQLAQVVMTDDVVFLAAFGDQWRVTAAGCTPRANRPYHCTIEGG
jgi:hypothetical protein